MDLYKYWEVTVKQDADEIKAFFHENAWVNWHNTNEQFTLEEYIRTNCEYPGRWNAQVERIAPQWWLEKKIGRRITP